MLEYKSRRPLVKCSCFHQSKK